MSIEAMKQALEALDLAFDKDLTYLSDHAMIARQDVVRSRLAITGLRAAIAEAAMQRLTDVQQEMEQEPVAWLIESYDIYAKRTLQRLVFDNPKNMQGVKITAYYTAPPKSKPLTNDEIRQVVDRIDGVTVSESVTFRLFARAIERAHGIGRKE